MYNYISNLFLINDLRKPPTLKTCLNYINKTIDMFLMLVPINLSVFIIKNNVVLKKYYSILQTLLDFLFALDLMREPNTLSTIQKNVKLIHSFNLPH